MVLLCLVATVAACGSSDGGDGENGSNGKKEECVETLPDCETAVCAGNYVRSCNEDRTAYEYELCFGMTCKNGLCQSAACTEPEKKTCTGPGSYEMCLANMSQLTVKDCPDDEKCVAGACVSATCKKGKKACGWQAVLTCQENGQGYTSEACGENQFCDETAFTCLDVDPFCIGNPLGARCLDFETRQSCQANGQLVAEGCDKEEVCEGGFCQVRLCGVEYEPGADADVVVPFDAVVSGDLYEDVGIAEVEELKAVELPAVKDIPPLEPVPKAHVTINGGEFEQYTLKYTSSKAANYVFKDKTLQISMAKGQKMMEVHFQGIEEGVVGNFSSDEPGSVNVWIVFNDGTTDQTVVQWKWSSVAFNATLDQFDPAGGWVKGTFAGLLEQNPAAGEGPPLELTDGFFEVPRKE